MYLGELTRLLLVHLHSEGAVFMPSIASATSGDPKPVASPSAASAGSAGHGLSRQLVTPWQLDTKLLSGFSADASPDLEAVGNTLRDELGMSRSTLEDRRIVQEVAVSFFILDCRVLDFHLGQFAQVSCIY